MIDLVSYIAILEGLQFLIYLLPLFLILLLPSKENKMIVDFCELFWADRIYFMSSGH